MHEDHTRRSSQSVIFTWLHTDKSNKMYIFNLKRQNKTKKGKNLRRLGPSCQLLNLIISFFFSFLFFFLFYRFIDPGRDFISRIPTRNRWCCGVVYYGEQNKDDAGLQIERKMEGPRVVGLARISPAHLYTVWGQKARQTNTIDGPYNAASTARHYYFLI